MSKKRITLNISVDLEINEQDEDRDLATIVNELGIDITSQFSDGVAVAGFELAEWSEEVSFVPEKAMTKDQLKHVNIKVESLANQVKAGYMVNVIKRFEVNQDGMDPVFFSEGDHGTVVSTKDLIKINMGRDHNLHLTKEEFNLHFEF